MKKILVSVSGGKDSTVCLSEVYKEYQGKADIIPYFCDTGWEHEETYKYLDYLEERFNCKIERLSNPKYKNGFEDMCIQKKAFPTMFRRFCTETLKIIPSNEFIKTFLGNGDKVINVVGVRSVESPKRANEVKWKFSFFLPISKKSMRNRSGVNIYQPIVGWSDQEVYDYFKKNDIKPNPLYLKGYTRVGCFPCIMANVHEIGTLGASTVKRIDELEKAVSKNAGDRRTFFRTKERGTEDIKSIYKRHERNTLGFDLGCVNQFGLCE